MKGLLIKDISLMKVQKNFFIIIIVLAVGMAFTMDDASFISGYLTFVMPLFALSTISYDEFDNGNTFLFTLPISRKGYVIEKYCFSLLLGIASLVLTVIFILCFGAVKDMPLALDSLKSIPSIFLVMMVILTIMIPLQLKFGAERGRIAIIAVGGIAFVLGYGIVKVLEILEFDMMALANNLSKLNVGVLIAIVAPIVFIIVLVSMKISISIMRKKEL